MAVAALAGTVMAQQGSIATTPLTLPGPAVFDTAGNLYFYQYGPVTPGAAQTQNGGGTCLSSNGFFDFPGPCTDAYVGKVNASGVLVFGTYLGGSTADQAAAITVDGSGNVFLTGSTGGSFPTTANAAVAASTSAKVFAAKISADGSRVLYSTYLPDNIASASGIAIDSQGNAYVAGQSTGGHATVVKLSADGSKILYSITLRGSGQDAALKITADAAGNAVVAGQTSSRDFPVTPGVLQAGLKGAQNLFIARLDPAGQTVFATYLGGSGTDTVAALATDSAGNAYVAGATSSRDFPTTANSFEPDPVVPLWNDATPGGFAAKVKADGTALSWSTYVMSLDHSLQAGVTQLAVNSSGEAYLSGLTGAGFPVTPPAPQVCFGGGIDNAFAAHLDGRGALLDASYVGKSVQTVSALSVNADGSVLLVAVDNAGIARYQIRFGGTGSSAPACLSPTLLNSATMSVSIYGNSPVVPGELITLTGFGIGPETGVAYQPDAQGRVPRELAGVQVLFDGQPAPLFYVQSRQINALAPVELSGQAQTNVSVIFNQANIGTLISAVADWGSPGVFRFQPGVSVQAAAVNQDGSVNGPSNPAPHGSVVSVWGTGLGPTDPPCVTGGLNPPGPAELAAGLSALIQPGSPPGTPAQYTTAQYAGSAPGLPCGVQQINLLVPSDATPGAFTFTLWSAKDVGGGAQTVAPAGSEVSIYVK